MRKINTDKIRNKVKSNKISKENLICKKQFPECPEVPNKEWCKLCPCYKSVVNKNG